MKRTTMSEWGASGLPPARPGSGRSGLGPDPQSHLGGGRERRGRPLDPADRRGSGSPRHPIGPNRQPERRSQLWSRCALRHRPPDPLCGHGAHGWRSPHLPPRHPLDQCVRPGAEPGRAAAGAGRPPANQPGPAIPSRLGVRAFPSPLEGEGWGEGVSFPLPSFDVGTGLRACPRGGRAQL